MFVFTVYENNNLSYLFINLKVANIISEEINTLFSKSGLNRKLSNNRSNEKGHSSLLVVLNSHSSLVQFYWIRYERLSYRFTKLFS